MDDNLQGLDRVRQERARFAAFEAQRTLAPGTLSPRGRIAELIAEDSFLELGALARSQLASIAHETPTDGVVAGFGAVAGKMIGVIADDPVVLPRTDGEVGENKRMKVLAHAQQGKLPVVYLADGAGVARRHLEPPEGRLLGRYSDRAAIVPDLRLSEREAPLVTVLFGPCAGRDAIFAAGSDLIIATPGGALAADGQADGQADDDLVDVRAGTDVDAIDLAARFLRLIPDLLHTPLQLVVGLDSTRAVASVSDDIDPDTLSNREIVNSVFDAGTGLDVHVDPAAALLTGVRTVQGYPVGYVVANGNGGRGLTASHLDRIRRVAGISRRFHIPLLLIQHGAAYDTASLNSRAYLRALSALTTELHDLEAPKLVLVVSRGHVLDDFVLGGQELGTHFVGAWPGAHVGTRPVGVYTTAIAGDQPAGGPWDAAGSGFVHDVMTPGETRGRLAQIISLLAPARALPKPRHDLMGRIPYR